MEIHAFARTLGLVVTETVGDTLENDVREWIHYEVRREHQSHMPPLFKGPLYEASAYLKGYADATTM